MATATIDLPARPMNLLHGGARALFVAGATGSAGAASGDQVLVAVIGAAASIAAVVIGAVVSAELRNRRDAAMARKNAEIRRLRRENARLKRRHDA